MKSSILITHKKCEGSISSTLRTRNSKKPSRMRVRSWKHQWLLLCLVKLWKLGVVHQTKLKTKLACILEADESTRRRMGNSIPYHHEDHIAGKGYNSLQHYNLVHKFIPMPQAMKIPAAKAAVDKEWEKLEKFSAWNLTKVKSKKEVIDEVRTSGAKVHFASLMDICHLKNAELEAKHQKYEGRVVLRGDFVKDNSGSCAVFTEQGSSASQMTAAKIMDIISRLPGCDGQAADAVSAWTQVKIEDAPKLLKIPKSERPDTWIRLPRHKWPKSRSSVEDLVVPLERNLYGHPLAGLLWERQFEKILLKHGWGKIPNWECLFVHREKGLFLSVYVDDIKLAGKKQNIDPMWKVLHKEVDLGEPTSFLDHKNLCCTQRQCEISKDIVDNYRAMFESRISTGGAEKLPFPQNLRISSWPSNMAGHAKKCVNDIVSWQKRTTQKLYKGSTPCIDDHQPFQRRVETRGRIVLRTLSNCSGMLKLGTCWTTWYSMVGEQTCTIDHKMDQSVWQIIISIDRLHSSYMWIQTMLPSGKHCQTMPTGSISRLRFRKRSWGFKIYVSWNIGHFREPYVCSYQLDVQETKFSFAQFNRSWNHFLGRRIEVGWKTRTWFMGSDRRSSSRKLVSKWSSTVRPV